MEIATVGEALERTKWNILRVRRPIMLHSTKEELIEEITDEMVNLNTENPYRFMRAINNLLNGIADYRRMERLHKKEKEYLDKLTKYLWDTKKWLNQWYIYPAEAA